MFRKAGRGEEREGRRDRDTGERNREEKDREGKKETENHLPGERERSRVARTCLLKRQGKICS